MTRVVLVPGVPALLPEYASLTDPVAPLRAACLEAVRWLGPAPRVVADPQGARVAAALLEAAGSAGPDHARSSTTDASATLEPAVLVVGNGSARRTEASPGPFDERAVPFDEALAAALLGPDPAALRAVDARLAEELWASVDAFDELAGLLEGARLVGVDFDEAPYGVQYWVLRWQT